jgi:hypothetical protein
MVMSGWRTAVNSYMAELNIARAMFATSRHLLTPLAKSTTGWTGMPASISGCSRHGSRPLAMCRSWGFISAMAGLSGTSSTPTVPMTADQARQRATALIEAAGELDRLM